MKLVQVEQEPDNGSFTSLFSGDQREWVEAAMHRPQAAQPAAQDCGCPQDQSCICGMRGSQPAAQGNPMKIPEKREAWSGDPRDEAHTAGWNACVDEITKQLAAQVAEQELTDVEIVDIARGILSMENIPKAVVFARAILAAKSASADPTK